MPSEIAKMLPELPENTCGSDQIGFDSTKRFIDWKVGVAVGIFLLFCSNLSTLICAPPTYSITIYKRANGHIERALKNLSTIPEQLQDIEARTAAHSEALERLLLHFTDHNTMAHREAIYVKYFQLVLPSETGGACRCAWLI